MTERISLKAPHWKCRFGLENSSRVLWVSADSQILKKILPLQGLKYLKCSAAPFKIVSLLILLLLISARKVYISMNLDSKWLRSKQKILLNYLIFSYAFISSGRNNSRDNLFIWSALIQQTWFLKWLDKKLLFLMLGERHQWSSESGNKLALRMDIMMKCSLS